MAVRPEEVLHVAKLARLELRDDELEGLTRDLSAILELVGQIEGYRAAPETLPGPADGGALRADHPQERESSDLLLAAPATEAGLFITPGALG